MMKFSDEFVDSMGRSLHFWWDFDDNEDQREIWKRDIRVALENANQEYPLFKKPWWKFW